MDICSALKVFEQNPISILRIELGVLRASAAQSHFYRTAYIELEIMSNKMACTLG